MPEGVLPKIMNRVFTKMMGKLARLHESRRKPVISKEDQKKHKKQGQSREDPNHQDHHPQDHPQQAANQGAPEQEEMHEQSHQEEEEELGAQEHVINTDDDTSVVEPSKRKRDSVSSTSSMWSLPSVRQGRDRGAVFFHQVMVAEEVLKKVANNEDTDNSLGLDTEASMEIMEQLSGLTED